jgi:peptide/nickel transport system permease protein
MIGAAILGRLGVGRTRRRFAVARRWELVVGGTLLTVIVVLCVVLPYVWRYSPDALAALPFQAPSWSHPFGTDDVGRDVFVRAFAAGRIDLAVAATGVAVSLAIGTLLGISAGIARRRWLDMVVMRIVDSVTAFPFLILALMLVVIIGPDRQIAFLPPGLPATVVAICSIGWAWYTRLARGQTLALRNADYIEAARMLGFSTPRIVARHIAPRVLRVAAAYAVADMILVVVIVASLSFVGAGVQPPTPEWGSMMLEGRIYLQSAWWITVLPGALLAVTAVALSLVADSLLAGRADEIRV